MVCSIPVRPELVRAGVVGVRGGTTELVMGGREVGQVNMFQRNISLETGTVESEGSSYH